MQVDPSRGQLSFAGQRGINANVSVDGADYNQPFFGGIRGGERSNNAFTMPLESIQEFQVVAAGYSAEFGRSTGGLVNAITKSGTNRLHGSAFYVNRNRDWAENNAFGQTAAPTQQQFGGSVGGPITKDRICSSSAPTSSSFSRTPARSCSTVWPGSTPAPTSQEAFDFFKALEEPFDTTNDAQTLLGRVDTQLVRRQSSEPALQLQQQQGAQRQCDRQRARPGHDSALTNNGTEKDNTNTLVGQYTSALGTNLLFEARGQYAREERPREANAAAADRRSQ